MILYVLSGYFARKITSVLDKNCVLTTMPVFLDPVYQGFLMAKCKLSGKKPLVGNNVSHAKNRTKMRQQPNIQSKRIWVAEENRMVRVKLSTRALRTVTKMGLLQYLRKEGLRLKDVTRG